MTRTLRSSRRLRNASNRVLLGFGRAPIARIPHRAHRRPDQYGRDFWCPTGARAESATAPTLDRWQGFVAEASQRFDLPAAWIRAVSGGDPRALSPKGAMGLMQIMPATWTELRTRYGLGADPYDPHDNIFAGTAYLRELYDRYGYPNLFAAYNAGPQRFDTHLFSGKPLPSETLAYLARLAQPTLEPPSADRGIWDEPVLSAAHRKPGTAESISIGLVRQLVRPFEYRAGPQAITVGQ
jgi:hypothetical protein